MAVYAVAIAVGIVGAAATRRSRWYVTPGFSTLLVFLLLLYATPQAAGWRFGERVGETARCGDRIPVRAPARATERLERT